MKQSMGSQKSDMPEQLNNNYFTLIIFEILNHFQFGLKLSKMHEKDEQNNPSDGNSQ